VVVLLDPGRAFDRGLLTGIARYVATHRPWEFVRPATFYQRFSGLVSQSLSEIRRISPDGIIANGTPALHGLVSLQVPVIVVPIDRPVPGAVHFWDDNRAAGTLAADHLVGLGLRSFAFAGFSKSIWSVERQQAFCERLAELGYSAESWMVPLTLPHQQQGRQQKQLVHWLTSLRKPVGIMACNDEFARSIAELCRPRGIRLPDEVALIGVDNDELVCEMTSPSISSVAFAVEQAGYDAAELLDRWMARKTIGVSGIPVPASRVVARSSTDVLAIKDEEVVKAIRFIRVNCHAAISVGDVVEATFLSQWTLNHRFQDCLGHPILKEIHRQRAAHIARLLTETALPIEAIAQELGYQSQSHLARFFRREIGMTPKAYRRLYR
jgi:LacI family transcriptional regulator